MDQQLIWKSLLTIFLAMGFSVMNFNQISPAPFTKATIHCDAFVKPSPLRTEIGAFEVWLSRSMAVDSMTPVLNGWASRDVSYSWENIKKFYNLESLAVHEYHSIGSRSGPVYVVIMPTDGGALELLHPMEYCYSMQDFRIVSRNITRLKMSRYFSMDKVDLTFHVNTWKLLSEDAPDKGWLVIFWYVFVSSSHQPFDKAYFVQIEYYLSEERFDRAYENSLVFVKETMASLLRTLIESL